MGVRLCQRLDDGPLEPREFRVEEGAMGQLRVVVACPSCGAESEIKAARFACPACPFVDYLERT
jgi:hypothetical protein